MSKGPGTRRDDGDQPAHMAPADLLAAYLEAVARRDQWVQAYVTLCLYRPTPSGCGSDWQLELTADQRSSI